MAIQDLTIVEILFKQIKNSGEVAILGTQAADSSTTGPMLLILMTPKKNNVHQNHLKIAAFTAT